MIKVFALLLPSLAGAYLVYSILAESIDLIQSVTSIIAGI